MRFIGIGDLNAGNMTATSPPVIHLFFLVVSVVSVVVVVVVVVVGFGFFSFIVIIWEDKLMLQMPARWIHSLGRS